MTNSISSSDFVSIIQQLEHKRNRYLCRSATGGSSWVLRWNGVWGGRLSPGGWRIFRRNPLNPRWPAAWDDNGQVLATHGQKDFHVKQNALDRVAAGVTTWWRRQELHCLPQTKWIGVHFWQVIGTGCTASRAIFANVAPNCGTSECRWGTSAANDVISSDPQSHSSFSVPKKKTKSRKQQQDFFFFFFSARLNTKLWLTGNGPMKKRHFCHFCRHGHSNSWTKIFGSSLVATNVATQQTPSTNGVDCVCSKSVSLERPWKGQLMGPHLTTKCNFLPPSVWWNENKSGNAPFKSHADHRRSLRSGTDVGCDCADDLLWILTYSDAFFWSRHLTGFLLGFLLLF